MGVGIRIAKKRGWSQALGCIGGAVIGFLVAVLVIAALTLVGNL